MMPIIALNLSKANERTLLRWAAVASVMLIHTGIWLLLMHFLYHDNSGSSSSGSGGDDAMSIVIGLFILIIITFAAPAAVTALAPRHPFLLGLLTAAVPSIAAWAERPITLSVRDFPHALLVAVTLSTLALLLAVTPAVLIRLRLRKNQLREQSSQADSSYSFAVASSQSSENDWPPPLSLHS